ncbi:MAG TPA: sugar transferase, partial [Fibrobacteraceae bacterium]|nr:sugar transferase [Fibrobacteraceae bacterium]
MFRATTLERTLLVISDFIAFSICFVIAFWVQFYSGWIADKLDVSKQLLDYLPAGVLLSFAWIIFFFLTGLYRSWLLLSRTQQALYVLRSILFGVVFL